MGGSGAIQPIHWGMFNLAPHDWFEPIEKTYQAAKKNNLNLLAPVYGEVIDPTKKYEIKTWWK